MASFEEPSRGRQSKMEQSREAQLESMKFLSAQSKQVDYFKQRFL